MLLFKKDKTHPTPWAVCKHSASFGAQFSTVDLRMRPDPKSPKATGAGVGSLRFYRTDLQVYLPTAGHRGSPLLTPEQAGCLQAGGEMALGSSSWDKCAVVVEELLGKRPALAGRPPPSSGFDCRGQQPNYIISRIKYYRPFVSQSCCMASSSSPGVKREGYQMPGGCRLCLVCLWD